MALPVTGLRVASSPATNCMFPSASLAVACAVVVSNLTFVNSLFFVLRISCSRKTLVNDLCIEKWRGAEPRQRVVLPCWDGLLLGVADPDERRAHVVGLHAPGNCVLQLRLAGFPAHVKYVRLTPARAVRGSLNVFCPSDPYRILDPTQLIVPDTSHQVSDLQTAHTLGAISTY